MKLNTKLTGLTLGLLGVVALASTASAFQGDPNIKGPNYSPERHAAMTKAFETGDYQAWKNLMQGKGRASQMITAENFPKFAEAHKLALSGDIEGAKKIRQELGLGLRDGSGAKSGMKKGLGYVRGNTTVNR